MVVCPFQVRESVCQLFYKVNMKSASEGDLLFQCLGPQEALALVLSNITRWRVVRAPGSDWLTTGDNNIDNVKSE